jgi:peptidoglycan/xylan/chitin deacetylase (PgdA/CDA1 family)
MAAGQLRGVPVLVYHALTKVGTPDLPVRERKFWVMAAQFQKQLETIDREQYKVVDLPSWVSSSDLEARRVAITFDDGRISDYELAFRMLIERGMTATFFVNTSTVGRPGYLSWSQAHEMQKHGMCFQSHSRDHVYLTRLSPPTLDDQLRHSREELETRLGRRVTLLAPPYGRFDERVIDAAHKAGYAAVCSGRSWPSRPGSATIDRVAVYGDTSSRSFECILSGQPLLYMGRVARAMALEIPKSLLLRFWPAPLLDSDGKAHS